MAGGGAAARSGIGLGVVLACLAGTLGLSLAWKSPCASGEWGDGRQYRWFCYSDIVPLYGTEQLAGGRLPYLDPCRPGPGSCDEYPVLTMYAMRAAAWAAGPGGGFGGFFYANAALLAAAAGATAVCLYLLAGRRALMFALAPTLLIYAFVNWDLIAVGLATWATLLHRDRRDAWAGALLGLGAAAKLYPALLVLPFALDRLRGREPDRAIHLAWAAAGAWLAVNLPFAVLAPRGWWEFFRFNAARPPDWDSLWFIACDRLRGAACLPTPAVNLLSAALFGGLVVLVHRLRARRDPGYERWTLAFPLLVLFLLSNKVYSPQYGLWLLPWFALAVPGLARFAAFEAADVAVFLTRFSWFARYGGWGGVPLGAFEAAVLVRAAVLAWCVVAWARAVRAPAPAPALAEAG
ncbi:MAG TPA: glycosyltransferase 87 family protein [Actinomycetota bacterium]|nr:glycosyltransferase 87 family protein [Actinomycetota bacterium]